MTVDWIVVLDVIRVLYAVIGGALVGLLLLRASRYRGRTRETAWLHLMACFLLAGAVVTALTNIGRTFTLVMPFNVLGIGLGWLFVMKTPLEKVVTWKERRGDDPDWHRVISGPDR